MSDQVPGPRPVAKIEIVMYENGRIDVLGPLDQRVLCYGLLDVARDEVKKKSDAAASPILRVG